MKTAKLLGLIVIVYGCGFKNKPKLADYLIQLPVINTPITLDSEKNQMPSASIKEGIVDSIQNFLPGYTVIGKLFETAKYVAVLFQVPNDSASPLIIVFDQQGSKLDEWLLYNSVGHDIGVSATSRITIREDQTFELVEIERHTLKYDSVSEIFYDIDSTLTVQQNFLLSPDGKFIRTDSVNLTN